MTQASQIKTVVFPVGGSGTRFLPITKSVPKEMLPILDQPLIHYCVQEAREAGIERFIFVTGRGKVAIEDFFDRDISLERELTEKNKRDYAKKVREVSLESGQMIYVRQPEPLGLGHAIACAAPWVNNEPFAVMLPDDFILNKNGPGALAQMIEAYDYAKSPCMAAVMTVPQEATSSYGILDPAGSTEGQLIAAKGLVEKPKPELAPSCEAIVGRYILPPQIMDELLKGKTGAGGEIQLTDAMAKLIPENGFCGYRYVGDRYDCGNHEGWLQANNAAFALRKKAEEEKAA